MCSYAIAFSLLIIILQGQIAGPNLRSEKAFARLDSMLDMTYASYEGRTLELDLYKPREKLGKLPAIVCIHGGGWAKGSRKNYTKVAQALAAHGYVAVTISYRLSGEAVFPAAIMDCKAAVTPLGNYSIPQDKGLTWWSTDPVPPPSTL